MSFFTSLMGNSDVQLQEFWRKIVSESDLETAIEDSKENMVVIFKHSTRCIISKTVLRNFEKQIMSVDYQNINFYFLDLLNYRNLSNLIAEKYQVTHQSPQILVLKKREIVHHASHESIDLQNVLNIK